MSNRICSKIDRPSCRIISITNHSVIIQGKMPGNWRYCHTGGNQSGLIYCDFGILRQNSFDPQYAKWAFYASTDASLITSWNWSEANIDSLIERNFNNAHRMTAQEVNEKVFRNEQ